MYHKDKIGILFYCNKYLLNLESSSLWSKIGTWYLQIAKIGTKYLQMGMAIIGSMITLNGNFKWKLEIFEHFYQI